MVRRAPRESGSGSCAASKVGGRMRSSSGPCGLSAQRFFASEISSACNAVAKKSSKRLERMGPVAAGEAEQGSVDSFADREHFEQLSHLRRRKQLLRLRRDRRVDQRILDVRLGEHLGDSAVAEKLRLRGVAQYLGAGLARRGGEGAEVDMRGDVLVARPRERVGMGAMAVMAHQRAGRALRVVVLVAREAIVDDQDQA